MGQFSVDFNEKEISGGGGKPMPSGLRMIIW